MLIANWLREVRYREDLDRQLHRQALEVVAEAQEVWATPDRAQVIRGTPVTPLLLAA